MLDVGWVDTVEDIKNRPKSDTCLSCGMPISIMFGNGLCRKCNTSLKANGLTKEYIPFVKVGKKTTPIQQSLHRRFFNCNAVYEYRGKREERLLVPTSLNLEPLIKRAIETIYKNLSAKELPDTLFGKDHSQTSYYHYHCWLSIKDFGGDNRITRRIVYNLTLFYYLYFVKQDPIFKNETQFKASVIHFLFAHIQNTFGRVTIGKGKLKSEIFPHLYRAKKSKYHYPNKYYYLLYRILTEAVTPIVSKLTNLKLTSNTKHNRANPNKKKPYYTKPIYDTYFSRLYSKL